MRIVAVGLDQHCIVDIIPKRPFYGVQVAFEAISRNGWLKAIQLEDVLAKSESSADQTGAEESTYSLLSLVFDKHDYDYNLWAFGEMANSFSEYHGDPGICSQILFEMRWPKGRVICAYPDCLHVLSEQTSKINRLWRWQCDKCSRVTTVTGGSVFDVRCMTPEAAIVLAIASLQLAPDASFAWLIRKHFGVSYPTAKKILNSMQEGFTWKSWNAYGMMLLVLEYFSGMAPGSQVPEDELYNGIVGLADRPKQSEAYLEPLLKRIPLLNKIWRERIKEILLESGYRPEDLDTAQQSDLPLTAGPEVRNRANYIELGA